MGVANSHMNAVSLHSVVVIDRFVMENILRDLENQPLIIKKIPKSRVKRVTKALPAGTEAPEGESLLSQTATEFQFGDISEYLIDNTADDSSMDTPIANLLLNPYNIDFAGTKPVYPDDLYMLKPDVFHQLLVKFNVHEADILLLMDMYVLLDQRGYDLVDIRDIFISFSVVVANSVAECVEMVFQYFDRNNTTIIDKLNLCRIFRLLNESCFYFGDKNLSLQLINDLADSIYTNSGKIDGYLCWQDNIAFIRDHPILQMYVSLMFQGPGKDKYMLDEDLAKAELSVRY